MNINIDGKLVDFPTTRYQGSKRKLLPWIYDTCKEIEFETVLDGFGGSGSVSYLFKQMNKEVHYNDKLKFNSLIGKALIENSEVKLEQHELLEILSNNNHTGDLISKYFENIYFLKEENNLIDQIVSNINTLNCGNLEDYKKAIAYYALFQTCLIKRPYNLFHRKNLNIRTADVKRNFGNKTTWEQPIDKLFLKFAEEANNSVFNNTKNCIAFNKSILDIDSYGYDLVYLDPPYLKLNGSNESADYLKCYHFLEGLSNYSDWQEKIDFNSINLRFKNSLGSNDFTVTNAIYLLEEMFLKFKDSIIVMSYKIGGIPSINDIEFTMRKFKKRVYTVSLHYKYALNKQNGNADLNREVLLVGI